MQESHETPSPDFWRRCNSCKKPIGYSDNYYVCNVSTCNRKRTGLVFCEVSCWDAHVPMMNHRESWAEERTAPTLVEWTKALSGEDKPTRKRTPKEVPEAPASVEAAGPPKVILRRRSE
jgi:hypothetical protein